MRVLEDRVEVPLDAAFNPTTLEQAVMVKVIYNDGRMEFFTRHPDQSQPAEPV